MPITKITKPIARALGAQVEGLLQEFCAKNGLMVTYEGGNFTEDTFSMKLVLRTTTPSSEADMRPIQFELDAAALGLPKDSYEKTTVINGVAYKIVGINLHRPKYPISVQRLSNGKRFKMTAKSVMAGLL